MATLLNDLLTNALVMPSSSLLVDGQPLLNTSFGKATHLNGVADQKAVIALFEEIDAAVMAQTKGSDPGFTLAEVKIQWKSDEESYEKCNAHILVSYGTEDHQRQLEKAVKQLPNGESQVIVLRAQPPQRSYPLGHDYEKEIFDCLDATLTARGARLNGSVRGRVYIQPRKEFSVGQAASMTKFQSGWETIKIHPLPALERKPKHQVANFDTKELKDPTMTMDNSTAKKTTRAKL